MAVARDLNLQRLVEIRQIQRSRRIRKTFPANLARIAMCSKQAGIVRSNIRRGSDAKVLMGMNPW